MATHVRSLEEPVTRSTSSTPKANPLDLVTGKAARALFALPFAVFGLFHLLDANSMAGAVPVPGGVFWIYFTGVALIAGAIGIITGILGRLAALGLAVLLVTFIVGVHVPGLSNPQMHHIALISLLKDVSLLGGTLTFAGLLGKRT